MIKKERKEANNNKAIESKQLRYPNAYAKVIEKMLSDASWEKGKIVDSESAPAPEE